MIALQEELDWQCYEMYGLLNHESDDSNEPVTWMNAETAIRGCSLGQRAFEIVMARQMAAGELETTWFERHGSTPITEIPADWPEDYRSVVDRRIHLIESNKEIGLIEAPNSNAAGIPKAGRISRSVRCETGCWIDWKVTGRMSRVLNRRRLV